MTKTDFNLTFKNIQFCKKGIRYWTAEVAVTLPASNWSLPERLPSSGRFACAHQVLPSDIFFSSLISFFGSLPSTRFPRHFMPFVCVSQCFLSRRRPYVLPNAPNVVGLVDWEMSWLLGGRICTGCWYFSGYFRSCFNSEFLSDSAHIDRVRYEVIKAPSVMLYNDQVLSQ
jgi:hypothetical protein